jgi:actin-related protein
LDIIDDAEITFRYDLGRNIILNGAVSQVKGLDARLVSEIKPLWNNVRVINDKPAIAAWAGASIVGSLATTEHSYITAKEYEDFG